MRLEVMVHGQPLTSAQDIYIGPSEEGKQAHAEVIARSGKLKPVIDAKTQSAAGDSAAECKGLMNGIEISCKEILAPFLAATRRIHRIKAEWYDPLKKAYDHATELLAIYRNERRTEQELAEDKAELARQKVIESAEENLKELQRKEEKLLAKLAETPKSQRAPIQFRLREIQDAIEIQKNIIAIEQDRWPVMPADPTPKLVGGREYTDFRVDLYDWKRVPREYQDRLLKVELRIANAKQLAKELVEAGFPLDSIPGLRIIKEQKVAVQGATSIRMDSPAPTA